MRVDEEKADLLQALTHIFKKADWCEDLCETAAGDGLVFLNATVERGKCASIKDKTAAVARFDAIKRGGVLGLYQLMLKVAISLGPLLVVQHL
jgi:hypothetical protein